MKKADASEEQVVVTNTINAFAEEMVEDIKAVINLLRRNEIMQAVDTLQDLKQELEQDYAIKNWQASLRERDFQ
tara:strand:+ start:12751 stop:12972 length:222 start_codon:yes stop_codon:yes gene_type:complete